MNANPFSYDRDRASIWEMLVARDSDAFVSRDWDRVAGDFARDRFEGIDSKSSADPKEWALAFPTLESYRDAWLKGAADFLARPLVRTTHSELIRAMSTLNRIEVADERALAWKAFRADEPLRDGGRYAIRCQTLYRVHRVAGRWRIAGFVGYLPLPDEAGT